MERSDTESNFGQVAHTLKPDKIDRRCLITDTSTLSMRSSCWYQGHKHGSRLSLFSARPIITYPTQDFTDL